MANTRGPDEAGPEPESDVEPRHMAAAELTPEEEGVDLDVGLELGLAGARFPAATPSRADGPLPASLQARAIGRVQRQQGNFAVQRLLKRAPVQRVVKPSADAGEDRLAERIENASGGGQPLEPQARARLETGLGHELADVRIHTDAEAAELAGAVDAEAFTSGRDIFFGPGTYQPGTQAGLELLAHEAAHTAQQASGPVAGTPAAGGVLVSDPADPFERAAERAARQVTKNDDSQPAARLDEASAPRGASVQRGQRPMQDDDEQKKARPEAALPEPPNPKLPEEAI